MRRLGSGPTSEPLGDRVVNDRHTGEQVNVSGDSIYWDVEPGADWMVVEVPGSPGEAGFSMLLPPAWELNLMRVVDGYVGEVLGDNMLLPGLGPSGRFIPRSCRNLPEHRWYSRRITRLD